MLKTLLSALIISGSIVATASFAYAQKSELDSDKAIQNYRANDPARLPVVLRIDPRTGTMTKLTLPAVPKSKEEAIKMISANASKFEAVPGKMVATTDAQAVALQKVNELDKDGGSPSWFRYGGFGYGRGWGGGYRGGWYGGWNYAPVYNYPIYSNWGYVNPYYYNTGYYANYATYYPCQGFGWGGNNYSFYYGNGFSW